MNFFLITVCAVFFIVNSADIAFARKIKQQSQPMAKHHQFGKQVSEAVVGELLVKFRSNFTQKDRKQFNQQVKANAVTRNDAITAFYDYHQAMPTGQVIHGWHRVRLKANQTVQAAQSAFQINAVIERVEPNYKVYAAALSTTYTPTGSWNDTYYVDSQSQWWIDRTKGDLAYAAGYAFEGTSNVVVAVVDTGVNLTHSDLSGRLVSGWDFVNSDADPDDDNTWIGARAILGHGTHVAGIIAGVANNAGGIAGTAWNSFIKIMPVKVLDSDGNGTLADVAAGITWAADNGAHIINMSLGTYGTITALDTAISYADGMGIMLIAAIGNDNLNVRTNPYYPAAYGQVLSVGATDSEDWVTSYSNYSSPLGMIDCVAPGGQLEDYWDGASWWIQDFGVTSTANTGGWSAVEGSSFAAPQVAALAAMLKLQVPSRTVNAIKNLILNNCEINTAETALYLPTDAAIVRGNGRIDVLAALAVYATPTPSPTGTPSFTATETVTPTHSPTITATVSPTSTITQTSTFSPTGTNTVLPTQTDTLTATGTDTPTGSPTITLTPTGTITRTASPTPTAKMSVTTSFTPTVTATLTVTASPTLTATVTPTLTWTPTGTITVTVTETATATLTATITPTFTITPPYTLTVTPTRTRTPTHSVTSTETASFTITTTPTETRTGTVTTTFTLTGTPTISITITLSATVTPTGTGTPTATVTSLITPQVPSRNLDNVISYPNPWRADRTQGFPRMVFSGLSPGAVILIYNMNGELVRQLPPGANGPDAYTVYQPGTGRCYWGMTTASNYPVASGVYIYLIKDNQGNETQGKIAILR